MSVIKSHGAGEVSGDFYSYKINQSLRFDDDSNTYLNRTPGSTSNQRTWTYSFWFKHGSRTTIFDFLLANGSGDKFFEFSLTGAQKFQVYYHDETLLVSTAIFRDPSSFYHILLRHDSTQSTADERLRIYVNGSELTDWDTNGRANLPQNFDGGVNESGVSHLIGRNHVGNNDLDGYLAEVHFVDGSSLAPSSFGELKDGIWTATQYSGSHGTNGFYLPFDDSSAIGDDESSNTNDWTANNFSATDVVLDSPPQNWCVGNPLSSTSNNTFAEGNLKVTGSGVNYYNYLASMGMETGGKYYYEVYSNRRDSSYWAVGICKPDVFTHGMSVYNTAGSMALQQGQSVYYLNSTVGSATNRYNSTEYIFSFAIDLDNNLFHFRADGGTWENSGDPAAGSGGYAIASAMQGITLMPWFGPNGANYQILNFGQDSSFANTKTSGSAGASDANGVGDFFYSPPSGFLALASSNLPDAAIIDGTEHFNTVTYTGDGASSKSITGVGFNAAPDLVWVKNRASAYDHALMDSVRGASAAYLSTNNTASESTYGSLYGDFTSFDSDGFTVAEGSDSTYPDAAFNQSSEAYVAWNWLAGTAFSNDASATGVGTIDSSGRANTTAGFSIVSYTGTGSAGTIKHGLSAAPPEMLIVKNRDTARDWMVYHSALGASKRIWLNYTYAEDSGTAASATWNDTAPTSTVFSVGTNIHSNESGDDFICYAFHSVEGYSKVGSYVGNGNSDGPFVYTGFRPSFLLVRRADGVSHWMIFDVARHPSNVNDLRLFPNLANAEDSSYSVDLLSNGFKPRHTGSDFNTSSGNYIYLAFADQPFKFSNAL